MNTRATGSLSIGLVIACAIAIGCGSSGGGGSRTAPAGFTVTPGVQQVTVTGAEPKEPLTLVSGAGDRLLTLIADDFGQATFAYIPAEHATYETGSGNIPRTQGGHSLKKGEGFVIRNEEASPVTESEPFSVLGIEDHPDPSHYEAQEVHGVPWEIIGGPLAGHTREEGVNYLTMRDGVTLSAMVRFPDPRFYGDPPYPTVIELSGYDPANPESPEPGSMIAQAFGYATVGVNLRGTGCSGGVFDVFSPAEQADGYDIVEIIARQPWVLHNHVGMVGLSYSGITQLYTASTRPPHLAAIAPLSVIEDAWKMSWPGGIYNAGFTKQWLLERERQSAVDGQGWASDRIAAGDTDCEANQKLRGQAIGFEAFVRALDLRPVDADERDLSILVRQIQAPVFLTGAWQDEQTGPRFATMLQNFTSAASRHFVVFNGHHPDGYAAHNLSRWYEFLSIYVAERVPRLLELVRAALPSEMESNFGVPLELDPDRFADLSDAQYAEARARWESDPEVTIDFEVGAGDPRFVGAPSPRFSAGFDQFPPRDVTPWTLYLDAAQTLSAEPPAVETADSFVFDPDAGMRGYAGAGAYDFIKPAVTLSFDWEQEPDGMLLSYLTAPLPEDVVIAGSGHANLWLRSEAAEAGLELVLSEVTPEGNEIRIQNGIDRAAFRKVDEARSDDLTVQLLYGEGDDEPVPVGEYVLVQVPIFPVTHPLRAGSQLRLQINTPGRDLPLWFFENRDPGSGNARYAIGRGGEHASSLVLPVLPAGVVDVPAERPACGVLRGQPCRAFVATENQPG